MFARGHLCLMIYAGFFFFSLFMQNLKTKVFHFKIIRIYNAVGSMNLKAKFLGVFFYFAFSIILLFLYFFILKNGIKLKKNL